MERRSITRILALTIFALVAFPGAGQAEPIDYYRLSDTVYDPAIPTPDAFLGHGLGDKPVRYQAMVAYLRQIAELSPRITAETIGTSHEGRPILLMTASSAENQARIEEIRTDHLRDPGNPDLPVVTWINYGVHGAESASMDALIPTIYHLAAAQGAEIDALLDGSVILAVGVLNPDGHVRRIDHVEKFSGRVPVVNPDHVQHQLWIEARTNHYWLDLNRQWLLVTQPESQAWTSAWHRWKAHVSGDYHEMGTNATYYFHPGTPSRFNPIIPDRSREILQDIAGYHVRFMDSEAKLFFTEELFDNFYIGKGSTYPHVNGSIGFLYETGAARGGRIESVNGERTYADNIRTHFRTSLTTMEGALGEKAQVKAYRREFLASARRAARADNIRGWVVDAPGDPVRLHKFKTLLTLHDIQAHALSRSLSIRTQTYQAGEALVIPMDQPQYRLIKGIMERVTEFEDPVFYDVSGWTLPLAYGLRHEPLTRGLYDDALLGAAIADIPEPRPAAPPRAAYGYMFDWAHFNAPRALYRLLDKELIVRAAFAPVKVETTEGTVAFGRGSIFVPFERQKLSREEIHTLVSTFGDLDGLPVYAVTSGLSPEPGKDLGAPRSFRPLKKPEVLLLFTEGPGSGSSLSRYDVGEVWHLLDHRMEIPVAMRTVRSIQGVDWSRYTHVILAGGRVSLPENVEARMKQWIREQGGVLIAARGTAKTVQESFLQSSSDDAPPPDDAKTSDSEETDGTDTTDRHDYGELDKRNAEHVIGGAIFEGDLDITHPMGFGYRDRRIASHRNTTLVLDAPDNPVATVVRYTDSPLLTGYASQKRIDEIKGTPMMIAERMGAGAVVLITDNLNFRGTFLGTSKLFLNTLFFSHLVDTPRSDAMDQ